MASNVFKRVARSGRIELPSGVCVFISHKSEDKPMARAVAEALTEMGVDIYFDEEDELLTAAARRGDAEALVTCIEDGLDKCTHLLGLVTSNSLGSKSWWIPYEIGGATGRQKECVHLVEVSLDRVPEFVKISRTLNDLIDLRRWVVELLGVSSVGLKSRLQPSTERTLKRFVPEARATLEYY